MNPRTRRPPWTALLASLLVTLSCGGGSGPVGDGGQDRDTASAPDVVLPDSGWDGMDREPPADPGVEDRAGLPDGNEEPGDDLPVAGAFGAPCRGNGDCASGYCVEGTPGPGCPRSCPVAIS